MYRRITVRWHPPASAEDRGGCHSVCHPGLAMLMCSGQTGDRHASLRCQLLVQHDRPFAINLVLGGGSNCRPSVFRCSDCRPSVFRCSDCRPSVFRCSDCRPSVFRCSGCPAQVKRARVTGCLRLGQGADGRHRCRPGCRRRYRLGATALTLLSAVVADGRWLGIWLRRPSG